MKIPLLFLCLLLPLLLVSHISAMPDTTVNRYATAEDADFWPNVNEGDYIFFRGNISEGKAIYAPADLYGSNSHLRIELPLGKKILIYRGDYTSVLINGAYCASTADTPTIVTNLDGQVRWGNNSFATGSRTFELVGFNHLYFTGKYDPARQTGDPAYLGHNGGDNMGTGDYYERYGFWGNPRWSGPRSGGPFGNGARLWGFLTLKVDYVASWGGHFASFNVKTDNPEVPKEVEVDIQDCFAGYGEGEGFYISFSTEAVGQDLTKLTLRNNIVAFAGAEALQTDNLTEGTVIENNVCIGSATFYRRPFQAEFQDNLHQFSFVEGGVTVRNNICMGTTGALHNFRFKNPEPGRAQPAADKPVVMSNNYYGYSRTGLGYMWQGDGITPYRFLDNVYASIPTPMTNDTLVEPLQLQGFFNLGNSNTDILFQNNRYPEGRDLFSPSSGNGSNVTAVNNQRGAVPVMAFNDLGFPDGVDWHRFSFWSDRYKNTTGGGKNGELIPYRTGDMVLFYDDQGETKFFHCLQDHAGDFDPNSSPDYWSPLTWNGRNLPPMDVRLRKDTYYNYRGMGLTYNIENESSPDLEAPVISLIGGAANFQQGTAYHEPGFQALDNKDGDLTDEVEVDWVGTPYDPQTPGNYLRRYRVTDAAGNLAQEVTREVTLSESNVAITRRIQVNMHRYGRTQQPGWVNLANDDEGLRLSGQGPTLTTLYDVDGQNTGYTLKIDSFDGGYSEHYKTHTNTDGREVGPFPAAITKSGLKIRNPHENPCVFVFQDVSESHFYDVHFTGYVQGDDGPLEATLYHEDSQQSSTILVQNNSSSTGSLRNMMIDNMGELHVGFRTITAKGEPNVSGLIIEEKTGFGSPLSPPQLTGLQDLTLSSGQVSSPLTLHLSDSDSTLDSLLIDVRSNQPEILPAASVSIQGSGASRQLTVLPSSVGTTQVTLLLSDGFNYVPYQFVVHSLPSGYLQWASSYFPGVIQDASLEESTWGIIADPDGDGQTNLLEYFWATNPTLADLPPEPDFALQENPPRLTIEINRDLSGIEWTPQWSADLQSWISEGLSISDPEVVGDQSRYSISLSSEISPENGFLRLVIQAN